METETTNGLCQRVCQSKQKGNCDSSISNHSARLCPSSFHSACVCMCLCLMKVMNKFSPKRTEYKRSKCIYTNVPEEHYNDVDISLGCNMKAWRLYMWYFLVIISHNVYSNGISKALPCRAIVEAFVLPDDIPSINSRRTKDNFKL